MTIFEAFPKAGGMLRYGIPSYRLPRQVLDAEIDRILRLGVELRTKSAVGKDISLEQVRAEYDAIFVGIGAHQGARLGCPGEDASNVLSGVEFLRLANSGNPAKLGIQSRRCRRRGHRNRCGARRSANGREGDAAVPQDAERNAGH